MTQQTIFCNNEQFDIFITEEQLSARIVELGAQLNKEYEGRTPIFIAVLNGSFIFFADLIREITIDCEIDFFKLSSYGDEKISSGNVKLLKDLNCQVSNRDIVIVEDIVDSGLSIDFIKKMILQQSPKSFAVVTLLYKKEAIKTHNDIEYIGFTIPNDFVIGYGLDYGQKARNLRAVYKLTTK